MTTAADELRVREEGHVAYVTLDRPPLNVLNVALLRRLDDALARLATRSDLRLIVLRGEGRAFSAGVDVGEHVGDEIVPLLEVFGRVCRRIRQSEVPTLAVVQGAALGGAAELVAGCDVVLAAEEAKIGCPEIQLGVVPPIAVALFPRIIGSQRAAGLVLLGEPIDGATAATWGLVWKAVPAERLEAEAEALAAAFAARSAAALRLARRTMVATARLATEAAVAEAERLSAESLPGMADAQEGLRAFLEKRRPVWTDS